MVFIEVNLNNLLFKKKQQENARENLDLLLVSTFILFQLSKTRVQGHVGLEPILADTGQKALNASPV